MEAGSFRLTQKLQPTIKYKKKMKIGILGTGEVGNLIGSRLIENGHQVMMGGREDNNQKGLDFVNNHSSENAFYATFAEASGFGEIIFNATNGRFALDALKLANTDFAGKIIIDVANPFDFTTKPPTLISELANTNSLGESIHYCNGQPRCSAGRTSWAYRRQPSRRNAETPS